MSALRPTNPELQRLRRISRRHSARFDDGAFLVDGPVLLAEALGAGTDLESVYVETSALDHPTVWAARRADVRVVEVADGALAKVLDVVTPQAMVAVAARATSSVGRVLDDTCRQERPVLVLVQVQDPGNAGTMVRLAEASGCGGVLCSSDTVDLFNPKAVRASAGSILRVPMAEDLDVSELLGECEQRGLDTVATVVDEGDVLDDADLSAAFALLIGSEAHGLPDEIVQRCDRQVSIPMGGAVESLNAAVAAAIVLFESARQRRLR